MSFRFLLLSLLLLVGFAAPASAQLPCVDPAADPCFINSTVNLPVGTYDIRPKSLVVGNKTITITGAGDLRIFAANITFQPGGRFIATGTDGNTRVFLDAGGTLELQSAGTSRSRIDVSGNFGGGTIDLKSVGDLTVDGTLIANASNLLGFGGPITLVSTTGNVTVTGDPAEGLRSLGNSQGGGGTITLMATFGSVSISTQLVAKGGDCGSCTIDLIAGTDIIATAQGVMDMRASGIGDGGFFSAIAEGNIDLAGNILANGSSDELEGGSGGEVSISAGGSVTVGGRVELNGAGRYDTGISGFSVDGDGGTSDISAGTTITMNGPMFGDAKGFGTGDEFEFEAIGNITFAATIDMTGDVFPGSISALSDALITVSARLRTQTTVDPLVEPSVLGESIDLEACQINITPTGEVIATGPGGNPSGTVFLTASTGLTIAGKLLSTDISELLWRTSAPVITGMATPPPSIVQNMNLPCCGVQCTVTTTTTTTTSTTTSSTSSTTSSSTSLPPSTVIPTTTTSSSAPPSTIIPTTTTSSSAPPTTVVPTTTTSSSAPPTTVVPTTTTSSSAPPTTVAPTTTTSSSTPPTTVGPTTTTSSSTPPTTVGPTTTTSSSTPPTTAGPTTTTSSSLPISTTTTSTAPSTTSTTAASTSTTIATTTSTSTVVPTTTLAPTTTSTIVVVTTSSTTTSPTPTTSTTLPPPTCADTTVGVDVVRCLLDEMNDVILGASQDDLGGKRLARLLTRLLDKATTLADEPTANKRLKKAGKQLRLIAMKLNKALAKDRADAEVVNELTALAGEAQSVIAGLIN